MKLFVFVFLGLIASIYCIGQKCGGNVKELSIPGCKEEPCLLKRGTSGTIELIFTPSEETNTLTAAITSKILNQDVPWPGMNKNACENCNIACPVKANSEQTYKYPYKILSIYPSISTTVTVKLLNDNKHLEACYQVKVKIA